MKQFLVPGLAPVGKCGQVGQLVLHILQDFQHTPELLIKLDACYGSIWYLFNDTFISSTCTYNLLPTSQPSEDARLARRQRIVPREEWRMRKNSRSSSESVSVRCKM